MRTDTLYKGDLVYVDVFGAPLIPGKVVGPSTNTHGSVPHVSVKVTAARPGYRRGEILPAVRGTHVIPRGNVRTVGGHIRVTSAVHFKLDATRPAE